jgi:hypothetical protein
MKYRNFISLMMAFCFMATAGTGMCYFFGIKSDAIEAIHVLFGLVFTVLSVLHICRNISSLKKYSVNGKGKSIRKELLLGLIAVSVLLLICFSGQFAVDLAHSGRRLFKNEKIRTSYERDVQGKNKEPMKEQLKMGNNKNINDLRYDLYEDK